MLIFAVGCSDDESDGGAGPVLDGFPDATLGADAMQARVWASGSAPKVFASGQLPISLAELELDLNEGTCPVKTMTGTTTTYEGGCTDTNGNTWTGRAVSSELSMTYDGFGFSETEDCNGQQVAESVSYSGTLTLSGDETALAFDLDLQSEGMGADEESCVAASFMSALSYQGEMREGTEDADADGEPDDQIWNGSGRLGNNIYGVADVETVDEVTNDVACDSEAVAGATTIRAGGHAIVIGYDGATDCDEDSTVRWSLDGVDQGELTGVTCSTGRPGGGLLLLVVGALVLRRRRSK